MSHLQLVGNSKTNIGIYLYQMCVCLVGYEPKQMYVVRWKHWIRQSRRYGK